MTRQGYHEFFLVHISTLSTWADWNHQFSPPWSSTLLTCIQWLCFRWNDLFSSVTRFWIGWKMTAGLTLPWSEASYILYELAGEAINTMTLSHDWEWHLGVDVPTIQRSVPAASFNRGTKDRVSIHRWTIEAGFGSKGCRQWAIVSINWSISISHHPFFGRYFPIMFACFFSNFHLGPHTTGFLLWAVCMVPSIHGFRSVRTILTWYQTG